MEGTRDLAARAGARVLGGACLVPALMLVACSHHFVPTAKMAEL